MPTYEILIEQDVELSAVITIQAANKNAAIKEAKTKSLLSDDINFDIVEGVVRAQVTQP